MAKWIGTTVVLIAVCIGGYLLWDHYKHQSEATDGSVTCIGCPTPEEKARFDKENSGDVADGNSERKLRTARAEDAAGNPEGAVAAGQSPPTSSTTAAATSSRSGSTAAARPAYGVYAGAGAAAPPPASDSQSANNPNNMRFGGSGAYQWYRQGNLTYRVDTVSGASCIAYATLEEWRKPIVYTHGCGRGA